MKHSIRTRRTNEEARISANIGFHDVPARAHLCAAPQRDCLHAGLAVLFARIKIIYLN